jgi:hypothetical protein
MFSTVSTFNSLVNVKTRKIIPPTDYVIYYTFDTTDISGILIYNKANSSYDTSFATLNTGYTIDTVNYIKGNSSLFLNATVSNCVVCPSINLSSVNGLSFTCWMRPVAGTSLVAVQFGAASPGFGFGCSSQWFFEFWGGDTYTGISTVYNVFCHVCVTFAPSTSTKVVKLYMNGILVYTSNVLTIPYGIYPMFLDHNIYGNVGYKGNIDDFKLYNRVLSVGEINALYNN